MLEEEHEKDVQDNVQDVYGEGDYDESAIMPDEENDLSESRTRPSTVTGYIAKERIAALDGTWHADLDRLPPFQSTRAWATEGETQRSAKSMKSGTASRAHGVSRSIMHHLPN